MTVYKFRLVNSTDKVRKYAFFNGSPVVNYESEITTTPWNNV